MDENARFVYYPVTSEAFKTSYGESYKNDFEEPLNLEVNQNDKKVINTLTDKINYVKKPSTDKEYEYMLSTFMKSLGVGGADASNQVVDLNNRYVIVEFGSTMSTRGSNGVMGDQGLPGPEMG